MANVPPRVNGVIFLKAAVGRDLFTAQLVVCQRDFCSSLAELPRYLTAVWAVGSATDGYSLHLGPIRVEA